MRLHLNWRSLPQRLATGAFILHSGIEKWSGDADQARAVHGLASGAYPLLGSQEPEAFLRRLATGEIVVGAALLTPVVSDRTAGALLTGFSGALLAMYARTPALRKPHSPWPSPAGIAVSKDVWMLGIGLGLLAHRARSRRPV
jgi:uncharacterized membrane protein YphA (DoxX/SURF4 family)